MNLTQTYKDINMPNNKTNSLNWNEDPYHTPRKACLLGKTTEAGANRLVEAHPSRKKIIEKTTHPWNSNEGAENPPISIKPAE